MTIWRIFRQSSFYFCAFFVVLNLLFTKQILDSNGVSESMWWVILVELVVEIAVIFGLCKMRLYGVPIEKQFLLMGLVLGILFILVLPPGQSPDEINHFRRAYGIARGELVVTEKIDEVGNVGGEMPKEVMVFAVGLPQKGAYEQIGSMLGQVPSGDESEQVYTSAALYNFVCYLPQTLAAMIGRFMNMSIVGIAYLMEIFNFVAWGLLMYFAIKLIPRFKSAVLFIALLPITLQEATSLSPDALTIGLSVFLISYVMYLAYGKKGVMKKSALTILYVIAGLIGFCKIVYLPLVLLYIIIPAKRFGNSKKKWLHLGIMAGMVLILNLSWLMISSGILIEFQPGVNSKEQLMVILTNPFRYIMTMFRTVGDNGYFWLVNALGFSLGSFSFHLPDILFFISFAICVLLFAQRDETLKLKKFDRAVFISVFTIVVILIFTSLYIQWTTVGAEVIAGVQGRYFLPILILIPVMVVKTSTSKKRPVMISEKTVLHYSLFINVVALITIFAQNI